MTKEKRKQLLIDNGFSHQEAEIISEITMATSSKKIKDVDKIIRSLDPGGKEKIEKAIEIYSGLTSFYSNRNKNNLNE